MGDPTSLRFPLDVANVAELEADMRRARRIIPGRLNVCCWRLKWDALRLVRWNEAVAMLPVRAPVKPRQDRDAAVGRAVREHFEAAMHYGRRVLP